MWLYTVHRFVCSARAFQTCMHACMRNAHVCKCSVCFVHPHKQPNAKIWECIPQLYHYPHVSTRAHKFWLSWEICFAAYSTTQYANEDTPRSVLTPRGSNRSLSSTRIPDSGSRIHDSGSRIHDSGSRIHDSGSRIHDSGSRMHNSGLRMPNSGLMMHGNDDI
jgi:hypothetical protein